MFNDTQKYYCNDNHFILFLNSSSLLNKYNKHSARNTDNASQSSIEDRFGCAQRPTLVHQWYQVIFFNKYKCSNNYCIVFYKLKISSKIWKDCMKYLYLVSIHFF